MTKDQASINPEDLYNLTQLAEVAAGRLSAGHVTELKDYIESNKYLSLCYEKAKFNACNTPHIQYVSHLRYQPTDLQEAINFHQQYQELYPIIPNGPDFNRFEANKISMENHNKAEHLSNNNEKNIDACEILSDPAIPIRMHQLVNCSSSDDDCNYYSHKVFDRKKLRRFTLPDNSSDAPRYDEHSCSSSSITSSNANAQGQLLTKATTTTTFMPVVDNNKYNNNNTNDFNNETATNSTEDIHTCTECGKKYSTSSNLARHRQTHRSIIDKKARRCPYCEKVYVSMPAFSMHVRTHNQNCECPFCGKCFSRPWLLQGHIRTHTGEKPFKCNICDKAFADKSNLRAHIQTHSNVKPHTCARCNKSFALKSYLYKHEESSCMKNTHRDDRKLRQLARAAANG